MTPDTQSPRQRRARRNPTVDTPEPETPKTEPEPEIKAPSAKIDGKRQTVLEKKLERMIVSFGLPFAAAGDMHCARHFAVKGPIVAEAWANLAAESPAVKEALESMLKGGAWTGAIGATAGLLVPVAAHHGAPLPPMAARLFGVPVEEKNAPKPQTPDSPAAAPYFVAPNGHDPDSSVPGPAAFSAPPDGSASGPDPTDPGTYPGSST